MQVYLVYPYHIIYVSILKEKKAKWNRTRKVKRFYSNLCCHFFLNLIFFLNLKENSLNSIDTGLGSLISNQSTVNTNNQIGCEKIDFTFQNEVSSSCSSTLNINLTDEKENRFEKHIESLLDNNNNNAYLSNQTNERKDQNVKSPNEKDFSTITSFDKDSYENSFSSELERLKSKSTATSTITVKNYLPIESKNESKKKNQNINENNQTNSKNQIDNDFSFDEDSSTSTCACSELDSIKTEEFCETFIQHCNKNGKF